MISPLYSADKGEKGFKSQKDIADVIDRNFLINTAVPAADFLSPPENFALNEEGGGGAAGFHNNLA